MTDAERQAWYLLTELEMRNTLGHFDDARTPWLYNCRHGIPLTECPHQHD